MDNDFLVERCGQFLYIETKRPTEKIELGAQRTLESLSRISSFTVLILRGLRNEPETVQQWQNGTALASTPTNKTDFIRRARRWFLNASRNHQGW